MLHTHVYPTCNNPSRGFIVWVAIILSFFLLMQDAAIEPQRYYELHEKDTIKFGNSR